MAVPDPVPPATAPTFAVLYRWRLVPGREEMFRDAWIRATRAIRALRGGLGSSLHRAEDGTYWAYAQWPDRTVWETFRAGEPISPEDVEAMRDGVLERFDPIPLDVVADLIGPGDAS